MLRSISNVYKLMSDWRCAAVMCLLLHARAVNRAFVLMQYIGYP